MGAILQQRLRQTAPMENASAEAVVNLLIAADYLRREIERILQPYNLSQSQYNILRILRGVYPEGHPRCEISSRMIERAPDCTRLIDRLEQMGLVERLRIPEDRRLSVARITPQGLALLEEITPKFQVFDSQMSNCVSVEECLALSRICEKIYADEMLISEQ
jgi:DNA-binding MarR family transcriptional regulator